MKHYISKEKNLSPLPRSKRRGGAVGGGGSSTTVFQQGEGMFLSRLYKDIAAGQITFEQGLKALGTIFLGIYDRGLRGGKLTPEGYAELERLWVRSLAEIGDGTVHQDEGGNDIPALQVRGDSTFSGTLSSPEFISDFLSGRGWSIQKKEYVNAAGVTETKYTLEVDNIQARNILRVYSMVASQQRGENDNVTFSARMKVHHYDTATGKVWLDTEGGELLNVFRVDDVIGVVRYQPGNDVASGGDGYIQKAYELLITEIGVGGATDENGDRLDWVKFTNFSTMMEDGTPEDLIAKGDCFTRLDNLTDETRKSIVQIITIGENAPYIDIVHGLKTDPDHALKTRIGNLEGIITEDFGHLHGDGIYTNHIHATGQFRNSQTGESLSAKINTTREQSVSIYKETTYDISEDDNHVNNGFFVRELEKWTPCTINGGELPDQEMTGLFNSGGVPLMVNGRLISVGSRQQAVLTDFDDMPMLKLNVAGVSQSFADMKANTTHKELTSDQGSETQDVSDTLYMGIRILPVTTGTLKVEFQPQSGQPEGFERNILDTGNWMTVQDHDTPAAPWNFTGTGKMVVSYTGECIIRFITLVNNPIESLRADYSTKVTQTARIWKAEANVTYATKTMHTELSLQVGRLGTEVTNNKQASDQAKAQIEARLGNIEVFDGNTATWMTQTDARFALWAGNFDDNGNVRDLAQLRIDVNNLGTTVGTLATTAAMESYVRELQGDIDHESNLRADLASSFNSYKNSISLVVGQFDLNTGELKNSSSLLAYINGRTSFLEGSANIVRFKFSDAWEIYHRDSLSGTETKVMGLDATGIPWFKGNIDTSTIINNVDFGNNIYKFRFSPIGDNGAQLLGYKTTNGTENSMLSLGFEDVSIPSRIVGELSIHGSSTYSSSALRLRSVKNGSNYDSYFRSGDISLVGAGCSLRITSGSIPEIWMNNGNINLGFGVWNNKMFIGCNKWPGREQHVPVGYIYVDGDGYVKVKGYDQVRIAD